MRVVGFDAATDDTVIAASRDGGLTFELVAGPGPDGRPTHSRELLGGITAAAESLGGWKEVDRFAVGLGPGTFTGLRIAVSTASGLAMSTGVRVVGVSTLEAMARTLSGGDASVVPVLDARRGEVFTAAYDAAGAELSPPVAVPPGEAVELIRSLDGAVRVGGPGAVRFADLFADAGIRVEDPQSERCRLSGASICELGVAADCDCDHPLQPIYIREPDAKLWLERDGRPPVR